MRRKHWPPKGGGFGLDLTGNLGGGGVGYLLNDQFLTTRAPGAVNGTAVEPGPGGNRVIRDVEGKIEITGGKLSFTAQVTPAFTDCDSGYSESCNRVNGMLFAVDMNLITKNYIFIMGLFNTNTPTYSSYSGVENTFYIDNAEALYVIDVNVLKQVYSISLATDYRLYIISRTAGALYLVKAAGVVKFVHASEMGGNPTLYLKTSNQAGVFILDNCKRSAAPVHINPIASEGFGKSTPQAIVSIVLDDLASLADFNTLAGDALARGYNISLALNTNGTSAGNWTTMQALVNNGHDIIGHSRSHAILSNMSALNIQYVGAGTECLLAIGLDTLTTTVTGGPGGEDLSLDLTNASYDTLTELRAHIDGLAAYTCAFGSSTEQTASVNLEDRVAFSIMTEQLLEFDATKYLTDEIDGCKADIEGNLTVPGGGTPYVCKGFAYPGGQQDYVTRAAVKAAGFIGARSVNTTGISKHLDQITDIYQIKSPEANVVFTAPVYSRAWSFLTEAYANRELLVLYAHSFATFSRANWGLVFDAIDAFRSLHPTLEVKTFSNALQYIVDNKTTVDDIKYISGTASLSSTDGKGHQEAAFVSAAGAGLAWTNRVGTFTISGTKAIASVLSGGEAIATIPVSSINYVLSLDLLRDGGNIGLICRYKDASNYIKVFHDGTNINLTKVVAGTPTNYAAAATYVRWAKALVVADGTAFRVLYNDVLKITQAIGDAALNAADANNIGIYSTDVDNLCGNLVGWARGNEGQYNYVSIY